VTGFKGIVECLSFDLYGCVQVTLRPEGIKKDDGHTKDAQWFDVSRLEVLSKQPVMDVPDFLIKETSSRETSEHFHRALTFADIIAKGSKGPAEKPMMRGDKK
jgi:hypothetical protein